jgi:hypothetical protein
VHAAAANQYRRPNIRELRDSDGVSCDEVEYKEDTSHCNANKKYNHQYSAFDRLPVAF